MRAPGLYVLLFDVAPAGGLPCPSFAAHRGGIKARSNCMTGSLSPCGSDESWVT